MKLILASNSKDRKKILDNLHINYEVIPSNIEENSSCKNVYDYVMDSEQARIFDKKLFEMISFLIPNYITEGKNQLVISIGCTGGKHRSVTIANALAKHMKQLSYSIKVEHRDIDKDAVTKGE